MKKRQTTVAMAMLMALCMLTTACGKKDEPVEPVETEPMIEVGQQNLGRVAEETEDEKKAPDDVFVPPIPDNINADYSFSTVTINTNIIDFASPDYKNSLLFMTTKEYQDNMAILALPEDERPKKFTPDKRLCVDGSDYQDFGTESFNFKGFAIKQNGVTVGYAEFFDNGTLVGEGEFDESRLDEYTFGGIYTDYAVTHYYDDDMNEVFPPSPRVAEPSPTPDVTEEAEADESDEETEPTPTDAVFNPDDYRQYRYSNFFLFDKSIYCGNGRTTGVLGTTSVEMLEGSSTYNKETMIAYFADTVNTIVVNYEAGDPNGKNDYEKTEKVCSIYFLRNDVN